MEKEAAIKAENTCPVDYAIKVSGVSKTFRIPHEKISSLRGAFVNMFRSNGCEEFKALDDVSFEVKKGEFFGIIGRNGSGKSTLLKILAGIYQPDKFCPVKPGVSSPAKRDLTGGKIKVNGLISPFLELGIGFNPELSGRDNVFLNAAVLGLSHKQIEEKFDDIVEFSELRRFIDQKVKNYSSGMQVRLMFSVAIHANREILLMDEVLAVGDSNFQSKCFEEFNKYRDAGKTVVLVTHDIGTVQRYCDRAMLLRNGKIEMIGDPQKVGSKYIYQNMSDEEKRIFDEEKRNREKAEKGLENMKGKEREGESHQNSDLPKRQKEKVAEITKVEFLDKDGLVKNAFKTGDDVSVRVYFKINKNKPVFNFGISLFSISREYIFGTNTIFDKIEVNQFLKKGYYQINFKNIPFTTNTYYVHTSIAGENFSSFYAFIEKSNLFKVYFDKKTEGLFDLSYSWEEKF